LDQADKSSKYCTQHLGYVPVERSNAFDDHQKCPA